MHYTEKQGFSPTFLLCCSDTASKSCCLLKRKISHWNCFQWPGLLFWFLAKHTALEEIPVTNCLPSPPGPCESSTREQRGSAAVLSVAAARLLPSSAARPCPTWAFSSSLIWVHNTKPYSKFLTCFSPQLIQTRCATMVVAEEVSRNFLTAGLPMTRSVKKSLQIRELIPWCNLCRKKFTRHFFAWLCQCRFNISQLPFPQSTLKIFVTVCFCLKPTEQSKLCSTACQHACEKSLLDACHCSA